MSKNGLWADSCSGLAKNRGGKHSVTLACANSGNEKIPALNEPGFKGLQLLTIQASDHLEDELGSELQDAWIVGLRDLQEVATAESGRLRI